MRRMIIARIMSMPGRQVRAQQSVWLTRSSWSAVAVSQPQGTHNVRNIISLIPGFGNEWTLTSIRLFYCHECSQNSLRHHEAFRFRAAQRDTWHTLAMPVHISWHEPGAVPISWTHNQFKRRVLPASLYFLSQQSCNKFWVCHCWPETGTRLSGPSVHDRVA